MSLLPFEDLPENPAAVYSEFLEFWAAYPRKFGRKRAMAKYAKARFRASQNDIMAGLARYKRNKPAYCDWMHPTTFLNGDHWEDDYTTFPTTSGRLASDYTPEALAIIAAHVKQPWYERGKYARDVLEQCVDAGLLTVDEKEAALR